MINSLLNSLKTMEGRRVKVRLNGGINAPFPIINNFETYTNAYNNKEYIVLNEFNDPDEDPIEIHKDLIVGYDDKVCDEIYIFGNNGVDYIVTAVD